MTDSWNKLLDVYKSSESVKQFKRRLPSHDRTVPALYYSAERSTEIIHCKIRLEISDLNRDLFKRHLKDDSSCACGNQLEDAKHYLLYYTLFDNARNVTIWTIHNYHQLNSAASKKKKSRMWHHKIGASHNTSRNRHGINILVCVSNLKKISLHIQARWAFQKVDRHAGRHTHTHRHTLWAHFPRAFK